MSGRQVAAVLGVAVTSLSSGARAEELFEIQVFHARIAPANHFELDVHSNHAASGPSTVPQGEVSTDKVLYEMLEPSFGIAPGWEFAAHIQQAFRPDGTFVWGGEKLRVMKLFTPDDKGREWHFALNAEGGYQPARFDPALWGLEIRPVIECTAGPLDIDFNPIVAVPFEGGDAGVPELAPALSTRFRLGDWVQPSLEYYADLGPVTAMARPNVQRHYLFETIDVVRWKEWIVHAGIGRGLTAISSRFVMTTLLGHIF